MKLVAYNDPGHGWIAVKRIELHRLGIADKVSTYSYQRGDTVYLEEDCDATLFLEAYGKTYGAPIVEDRYCNGRSPIRSYEAYQPD